MIVPKRIEAGSRYSEAIVHNGTVYLAGQVAADASQGISDQTRQVLSTIEQLLERAGSDKSCILMVQIFLSDLEDFSGMNAVWDEWVVPGQAPCRATVQAKLAKPEWKIEVVVIAAVSGR